MKVRRKTTNSLHHGFTLVELLVVIVIIAILIGLLVPVIAGAMRKGRIQEVVTEISALENSIADFEVQYGRQPPSLIILDERPASNSGWTNARSRAIIRSMWPQFNFDAEHDVDGDGTPDGGRDINNDGDTTDVITLTGAECLAFFLGGMDGDPGADWQPNGFAKNPADPFSPSDTNRVGPFHEFAANRFVDVDSDGIPEYLDPLPGQQWPYLYANSNGQSYDNTHLRLYTSNTNNTMSSVYTQKGGNTPWKAKSFQIISAGIDGDQTTPSASVTPANSPYGPGGVYDPDANNLGAIGEAGRDNITNFHAGTLSGD